MYHRGVVVKLFSPKETLVKRLTSSPALFTSWKTLHLLTPQNKYILVCIHIFDILFLFCNLVSDFIYCLFIQLNVMSFDALVFIQNGAHLFTFKIHWGLFTPNDFVHVYLKQWFRQWLVAWNTKPLPEPMLTHHQCAPVTLTKSTYTGNDEEICQ